MAVCSFLRCSVFLILLALQSVAEQTEFKLVCYYTNWAIYRPTTAKFTPQNINPYLCTHLIYAFGGLSSRFEIKPFDSYNDIQQGNYQKFTDLKKYNPKLKTMIAIGGWNEGSKKFSKMVASEENRQTFVRSVMKFLRQHSFDGLDLDWEYPTFRDGSHPEDREGYLELVRELRKAIDSENLGSRKQRLLLTMAVPAGEQYIEQGYNVEETAREVDFFNLLTYDYYTTQEGSANHHSALFEVEEREEWDPKRLLNVDWTVNRYLELGAPADKLIVGIPAYGRAFTLEDPDLNELGSSIKGPAEAGNSTREEGYLAYHEICKMVKNDEWHVKSPFPDSLGPYAYNGDQWVGYDDESIVATKAKYIVEHKLGGAMFWALDTDDFRGNCGEKSPLITAARKVLMAASVATSEDGHSSKPTLQPPPPPTTTTTTTTTSPETTPSDIIKKSRDDIIVLEKSRTTPTEPRIHENRIYERSNSPPPRDDESLDSLTTPVPPTTPDPGPAVECKDEGFFPNPVDCRKYFWCLDSGPADLGIVPHHFTCPSGLHFNTFTDSCDYAENVKCTPRAVKTRENTTIKSKTETTAPRQTTTTETEKETEIDGATKGSGDGGAEKNPSIAQLIDLIKTLGGVEEVAKHLGIGDKDDSKVTELSTTDRSTHSRQRQSPMQSKTTTTKAATTTTEKSVADAGNVRTELARKRGSIRHHQTASSATSTEKATAVNKARRQRVRGTTTTTTTPTTTATSKPTAKESARRNRLQASRVQQKTSTARSDVERFDSLEDSSVKYSTVQRTVAQLPNGDGDDDDDGIESKSDGQRAIAIAIGVTSDGDDRLETFGATRIPGLFRYVPLVRGTGTTTTTTTESGLVGVAEQLQQLLNAADKGRYSKSAGGGVGGEDVSANESTNNVQITVLDPSTPSELDSDPPPPPFENIGVRIDNVKPSPSPSTSSEVGLVFDANENEKDDSLDAKKIVVVVVDDDDDDIIEREGANLDKGGDDAVGLDDLDDFTVKPEAKTGRPSPIRSTTTTTTTPPPPPRQKQKIRKRISLPPSPPLPRINRTSTVSTGFLKKTTAVTPKRASSSSLTTISESSIRVASSTAAPAISSPRVKFTRRPGPDPGSTFQGLTINDKGDIECVEQGIYPHPVECSKFVSCVSVHGSIVLWTYACPNGQLYDDFTGRCLEEELVECEPV